MAMAGHGMLAGGEQPGLLSNRSFVALWLGQAVSNLGDKLLHINAIGFAVLAARGAGGAMAQVLIWATLPALLVGLLAGVVVDRLNRKRIMIASDLVRAGLLASLPWAAAHGFGAVCLVIALVASASCFFGPARTALIPSTVPAGQLVAANAWFVASGFLTALIGTAVGGWLLLALGLQVSLWVNAGVFLLSALAIGLAALPTQRRHASHGRTFRAVLAELKIGARLLWRHQALRAMALHYAALMGIATTAYIGLVGLSGHDQTLGLKGASLLLTAAVIGLLLGGLLAQRLSRAQSINRLISLGLGLIGAGAAGLAAASALGPLMAWLMVLGAGGAIYASVTEATLQRVVPEGLRGRVLATRGIMSSLAVLAASLATGWLIDHAGKEVLFGLVASVAGVGSLVMWLRSIPWLTYRLVRWFFRQLTFAYLHLSVEGLGHIPASGGAIVAGNHPNVMDGLLLLVACPRRVRFLIAEDMYTHRYLHWLFKALGMIPVYRTKTHNGEALRAAIEALQRGEVLGIFPEGTTHFRGSMEQVKQGVAILALKTGVPVVPFAIDGSAEAFPKGAKVPKPETVRLRFEEAVRYQATEANPIPEPRVAEVLEELRRRVLVAMRHTKPSWDFWPVTPWIKELQIALSAVIVYPLAGFLTCTSNPSLDPNARRTAVSR